MSINLTTSFWPLEVIERLETGHRQLEVIEGLETRHHRLIRSAEKCPPIKSNGFSPFAFLAFILISVNTVMNIG